MLVNVNKLEGAALDWAIAKCEGLDVVIDYSASWRGTSKETNITWHCYAKGTTWEPSIDWAQGGPIIERIKGFEFKHWLESKPESCCEVHIHNYEGDWVAFGPTPLIAAMRCFCCSKLGDVVDIPDEIYNAK